MENTITNKRVKEENEGKNSEYLSEIRSSKQKKYRRYSIRTKSRALYLISNTTIPKTSKYLDIPTPTLYNWRKVHKSERANNNNNNTNNNPEQQLFASPLPLKRNSMNRESGQNKGINIEKSEENEGGYNDYSERKANTEITIKAEYEELKEYKKRSKFWYQVDQMNKYARKNNYTNQQLLDAFDDLCQQIIHNLNHNS